VIWQKTKLAFIAIYVLPIVYVLYFSFEKNTKEFRPAQFLLTETVYRPDCYWFCTLLSSQGTTAHWS